MQPLEGKVFWLAGGRGSLPPQFVPGGVRVNSKENRHNTGPPAPGTVVNLGRISEHGAESKCRRALLRMIRGSSEGGPVTPYTHQQEECWHLPGGATEQSLTRIRGSHSAIGLKVPGVIKAHRLRRAGSQIPHRVADTNQHKACPAPGPS